MDDWKSALSAGFLSRYLIKQKDQRELDSNVSTIKRKFESWDREALVLCDATKDYPWRTVRSRVNGARLFIEKSGRSTVPDYALPTERILSAYPRADGEGTVRDGETVRFLKPIAR